MFWLYCCYSTITRILFQFCIHLIYGVLQGEYKEEGQGGGDEEKGGGEATPSKYFPIGTVTLQKRKVSPKKPSARKKTCANKAQLEATLTEDDINLVHGAMEDVSDDIL